MIGRTKQMISKTRKREKLQAEYNAGLIEPEQQNETNDPKRKRKEK